MDGCRVMFAQFFFDFVKCLSCVEYVVDDQYVFVLNISFYFVGPIDETRLC